MPTIAHTATSEANGTLFQQLNDHESLEPNNNSTAMLSTGVPSEPSSLDDSSKNSVNDQNSNSTSSSVTPKTAHEYKISMPNKVLVFILGGAILVSIFLLIGHHRVHSHQLAELRRQQQERRNHEEALKNKRNETFLQRFHCTVIDEDGSNAVHAQSSVLSFKQSASPKRCSQPSAPPMMDNNDIEQNISTSEESEGNDSKAEQVVDIETPADKEASSLEQDTEGCDHETIKSPERRPSSANFLGHFWKTHEAKENECSICLGGYCPGDTICVAEASKCDHVFHQDCIAEWLKTHDCCPLCRVDLMGD